MSFSSARSVIFNPMVYMQTYVHTSMQVNYRSRTSQLRAYTRTELPPPAYYCAIANGANDKESNDQQRKVNLP